MAAQINKNPKATLKEALQRFVEVYLQGRHPDIDEFVKQYPQHEDQLKQRIQDLREIDTLFDSIFKIEGSEFEDEIDPQALVGRKVRNFEIVKLIGRGGMGVVYQARDTKLDRSVAIKSIPVKLARASKARTRFKREAQLLASLNHPNIAMIHEIIEEDTFGYLVLEYVPGETLAERIAREPLLLEEALSIGRQIAEAISSAHKKGVVHRDLKPGNIKITPDGEVKILDFGLAKAFVDESGEARTAGHIIGTPAYMSPEQAQGIETDYRTDIWSFGCIMFQMLSSRSPFECETVTDTVTNIIECIPDWELLPHNTPASIRTLLSRCLEKDHGQRLGDMSEVTRQLEQVLNADRVIISAKSLKIGMMIAAASIIVISIFFVWFTMAKHAESSSRQKLLVVLPFKNSGLAGDVDLCDSITDEVTTRLELIRGLRVISQQSAVKYKSQQAGTLQIAQELNVDYIIQGTIQYENSLDPNGQVKIEIQLIDTTDNTITWSRAYNYDRRDILPLNSEVVEHVAQALDITLIEPERRLITSKPTEDKDAFEYYLQGNKYYYQDTLENSIRTAIGRYEIAVDFDPKFALAWARLSMAHMRLYWFGHDHNEKRIMKAKTAAFTALELDPDLSEVQLAVGRYYYQGHLDYDSAMEYFETAQRLEPDNSEVLLHIGAIHRRQGNFKEALAYFKKASELDPLNYSLAINVGTTLLLMKQYTEAEQLFIRYISLAPDLPMAYDNLARLYLRSEGNTEKAKRILNDALKNVTSKEKELIPAPRDVLFFYTDCLEDNYQQALDRLPLRSEDINDIGVNDALRYASIYGYTNKKGLEREYYEQAKNILEPKILNDPNDSWLHSALGISYAGLDRKEDAIREGQLAVELLPVSKDAMRGPSLVEDLARIYTMVGEFEKAIDQLDLLLSMPSEISIPLLKIDPTWDPLRDHPRFKKLIDSDK